MRRRQFMQFGAAAALALHAPSAFAAEDATQMVVYKDPNCGCCKLWADAMVSAGFSVEIVQERDLISVKKRLGVPLHQQGCHTTTISGIFLEGHVPLDAVRKVLASPDGIAGLVVAGMPYGSLGMGDDPSAEYDVLAVSKSGETSVYLAVRPKG